MEVDVRKSEELKAIPKFNSITDQIFNKLDSFDFS